MTTLPICFPNAYILSGPTGSGKSALALELAERLDAEIIAMDSMTLFRHMDIGTAKPSAEDRLRIRHHLIDILDPWEKSSVAEWLDRARLACQDIESRGRRALFVGGTALYLKALLRGLFEGPPADDQLRTRLAAEAERLGKEALHHRLATIDPASAGRLHPHDVRRVIRALEVWELTGRPISSWQTEWSTVRSADESPPVLWLDLPREELYRRINDRVVRMIEQGLVDEARSLLQLGRPISREAQQALGYREIFEFLQGRVGLEETIVRIQTRSRNFAKRQLTWFRALPECRPATTELTFELWGLTMGK